MKRLTIIVDLDDVCIRMLPEWIKRYNRDYDDCLTADDILAWDMTLFVKPECGMKIYNYLLDPSLYDNSMPIAGALEGVRKLRQMGHQVLFVTADPGTRKLHWLQGHGFLGLDWQAIQDYICCYDKKLIRADVIVDDRVKTVEEFPGYAILFSRKHNEYSDWQPRAMDWQHVLELISEYAEIGE